MSLAEAYRDPLFVDFMAFVREMRAEYEAALKTAVEPVQIYRAQGAIEAITRILDAPEEEKTLEGMEEEGTTEFSAPH